jgi:hypothetical protein
VYSLFLADDGRTAEATDGFSYPVVRWVREEDGTRARGDLQDRAARYLQETNELVINEDFRIFRQMMATLTSEYSQDGGNEHVVSTTVKTVVKEWFEQILVEVVLGAVALGQERRYWDADHKDSLLDEEALDRCSDSQMALGQLHQTRSR